MRKLPTLVRETPRILYYRILGCTQDSESMKNLDEANKNLGCAQDIKIAYKCILECAQELRVLDDQTRHLL